MACDLTMTQIHSGWPVALAVAITMVCSFFLLEEPKGQMHEVLPDGTVQMIEVC